MNEILYLFKSECWDDEGYMDLRTIPFKGGGDETIAKDDLSNSKLSVGSKHQMRLEATISIPIPIGCENQKLTEGVSLIVTSITIVNGCNCDWL